MSITNTQTKYFTSGEIKFSAIRDTFGDLAGTDVRASDYLRNAGDDVDWEAPGQTKTISPRVPNATENADVSTSTDWEVSDLRDSIVEYNVVQDASTSDEELEYADTNVPTWNNNLSKNVNKKFSVEGTIYANEVSKYALTFSDGEYNNLTIDVPDGGKIYGSLDLFVTLLHQFHHVGIHEINRQISTQQNDNGSKENTHEKVLIKERVS